MWQQTKKQCKELHTKLTYIKGLIAAYDKSIASTWHAADCHVNAREHRHQTHSIAILQGVSQGKGILLIISQPLFHGLTG